MKKLAITGLGILSSIGKNTEEFRNSLKDGKSGITFADYGSAPEISVNMGALIRDFSFRESLEKYSFMGRDFIKKAGRCSRAPLSVQVSVLCCLEAYINALLHENKVVGTDRIALVVGGANISPRYTYDLYKSFVKNPEYLSPAYPLHYMDTDHVGVLSELFEIKAEGFTVGGASASGNVAIINGCRLIQLGLADICMVVGAMADLSPMELQGFYNIGAIAGKNFKNMPDKACRPFDKEAEGFVYGQAGACLILESFESAEKRKANIIAEIRGSAIVLDGNPSSAPDQNGEVKAMKMAIKNSELSPENINYINAHGTSSPLGDKTEIAAIKQVFGNNISKLRINSTKSLTGHCLYSAGVVETIATVIQMHKKFLHPNINLHDPIDKDCRFAGAEAEACNIYLALSNSFGFGGINTAVVIGSRFTVYGYQSGVRY